MAVFLGSGGQAGVHEADLGPALSSWTWRLPSTLGVKYCLGMYFWYDIWKGACACAFRQEEVRERSLFTLLPQTWRPSSAKETAAFSPSLILLCIWMMCGDMRHEKSAHTCFERELWRYAGYGKHEQRWECLCDLNERLITRTAFHSPHWPDHIHQRGKQIWINQIHRIELDMYAQCAIKSRKLECCFQRSAFIDGPAVFAHWIM